MRKWFAISAVLFVAAIALLSASVLTGESEFGLFLIFPFLIGSGLLALLGVILLFIAIFIVFMRLGGRFLRNENPDFSVSFEGEKTADKKFGGVIMLGPIPIVFGSDRKIARIMMIIGLILMVAIILIVLISII